MYADGVLKRDRPKNPDDEKKEPPEMEPKPKRKNRKRKRGK